MSHLNQVSLLLPTGAMSKSLGKPSLLAKTVNFTRIFALKGILTSEISCCLNNIQSLSLTGLESAPFECQQFRACKVNSLHLSVASVNPRPTNISRAAQTKRQKYRCVGESLGNALHKKAKPSGVLSHTPKKFFFTSTFYDWSRVSVVVLVVRGWMCS